MGKKHYTEEQDQWIIQNRDKYNGKQLAIEFEKQFGIYKSEEALGKYAVTKLNCPSKEHCSRYTKEQDEWLIKNFRRYPLKEFTNTFNKKFKLNKNPTTLFDHIVYTLKCPIIKPVHYYTKEQDEWLNVNYYNYSREQLSIEFNKKFNLNQSKYAVATHCLDVLNVTRKHPVHKFTKAQDKWLCDNRSNYTTVKLTELFNKKFNTNLSHGSIQHHILDALHIKIEDPDKKNMPIGKQTITSDKVVKIKVSNNKRHNNWKLLGHLVWEQHYGPLPKGYRIIFLDGDSTNCAIENLKCVTHSTQVQLACRKWYGKGEITEAGIQCLELEHAIKECK